MTRSRRSLPFFLVAVTGVLLAACRAQPAPACSAPSVPAAPAAPAVRLTAPPGTASTAVSSAAGAPVAPATEAWPTAFPAFVARLRADAAAGRDADLADFADLLAAVEAHGGEATAEATLVRLPDLEAALRGRFGGGTGWATLTAYREAGAAAGPLQRAYLDYDRVAEWTGKPGARLLARHGDVYDGEVDALRQVLGFEYGARWRFRARALTRGPARLVASRMVEPEAARHMRDTRELLVVFPEPGGARVVEASGSALDYEVPPLLRGIAAQAAADEMKARVRGVRAHWRDYAEGASDSASR